MQRRDIVHLGGAAFLACAWPDGAAAATAAATLFTIARSKNRNVVRYQARLRDGALDPEDPIEAFWLMLAEDGRREELSWAERKLAYGFSVSGATRERCVLGLTAFKTRPLVVERMGQRFGARVSIAGKPAMLERIFVQANEGALLPSVERVDLFGRSLDGTPLVERIPVR